MAFQLISTLEFANCVLVVLVLVYAIMFIRKTQKTLGRRPWLILMAAVIVLLFLQLAYLNDAELDLLKTLLNTAVIGLILFVFVMQDYIFTQRNYAGISRKQDIPVEE